MSTDAQKFWAMSDRELRQHYKRTRGERACREILRRGLDAGNSDRAALAEYLVWSVG